MQQEDHDEFGGFFLNIFSSLIFYFLFQMVIGIRGLKKTVAGFFLKTGRHLSLSSNNRCRAGCLPGRKANHICPLPIATIVPLTKKNRVGFFKKKLLKKHVVTPRKVSTNAFHSVNDPPFIQI